MTGITDVLKNSQELSKRLFGRNIQDKGKKMPPQPQRPDPRPSIDFKDKQGNELCKEHQTDEIFSNMISDYRWAVLCPVTSRGSDSHDECLKRLENSALSLVNSISPENRNSTKVFFGYDMKDPLYDPKLTKGRVEEQKQKRHEVRETICKFFNELTVRFIGFPPVYNGSLCWIWEKLAKTAVDEKFDFFILLGDDVEINDNWQQEVLNCFCGFALQQQHRYQYPFGFGCVAIKDKSFPVFPTFPVIHRTHFDIFGELFPRQFKNQHGDPYLFEIYRRFGNSVFTQSSFLDNTIGGAEKARYKKSGDFVWRDKILTKAINKADEWVRPRMKGYMQGTSIQISCIDMVIPTYRCDLLPLKAICDLKSDRLSEGYVDIHKIIVVDKPDASNLCEIKKLESYDPHNTIRVYVMPSNKGASIARNTGLAQSFGDHSILLDDDVVPNDNLIDAYLGAIERNPSASVYVGLTRLPPPQTLIEKAMKASRICYFYGIATVCENPPWGVSANMCVKSRTNNNIWFSDVYPKTGGGEDVDYCLRLKGKNKQGICAVREAIVTHPYWASPLSQTVGWASGDVLCLDQFPNNTFWCFPNWCESTMFILILILMSNFGICIANIQGFTPFMLLQPLIVNIAFCVPTYYTKSIEDGNSRLLSLLVGLVAVVFPSLQELVRMWSKLKRLRFTHLCYHFDWMHGQRDHISATLLASVFEFLTLALVSCTIAIPCTRWVVGILCLTIYTIWVCFQYKLVSKKCVISPKNSKLVFEKGKTPFVILATQRTGSNMLCGYLHNHLQILMHNELFNEVGVFSPKKHDLHPNPKTFGIRDTDPTGFLQKAYDLAEPSENAVGFKLFPDHMMRSESHCELFNTVFKDPRVRKIILVRRNRLQVCVSMLRASISSNYTHKKYDDCNVQFQPDEFQSFVKSYDKYYDWLKDQTLGTSVMTVTYEDLANEQTSHNTLNEIANFLGVDKLKQWNTSYPKQSESEACEGIVNYTELSRSFKYHPEYHALGFK